MNITIVESEIPPDHPAKREIEQGLLSVVSGLRGEWRITLVCSRTSVWWVLHVNGPDFKWMAVLADPATQNVTEITGQLLDALRESRLLS